MSLQHTSQRCFAPLNWDAVIPLLLVMLPNLETFETHSFVGPGLITFVRKELMGKDFALAATRQRQLPSSHSNTDDNYAMSRLKTVSMTMLPEEADGGLLQSILPIVQLPSLTTFTCRHLRIFLILPSKMFFSTRSPSRIYSPSFHTGTI
jgi:hypothetical protein